jgi:hypothetical protein
MALPTFQEAHQLSHDPSVQLDRFMACIRMGYRREKLPGSHHYMR